MANLTDTDFMPFGKFKGTAMANVPASYLAWAKRTWILTPTTKNILGYIQDNWDAISIELVKEEKFKSD